MKLGGTMEHVQEHGALPPGTSAADPTPGTLVLPGLSLAPPSSSHCQHLSRRKSGCREGQGPMGTPYGVSLQGVVVVIPTLGWQHRNAFSRGLSGPHPSQFRNCVCPSAQVAVARGGCPGWVGQHAQCMARCLAGLYGSWPRLSQPAS